MKRFLSIILAFRGLTRRPLRAILTTGGIILGVGMVVAVLSLSQTLLGGFNDLFDTVYGRTDVIVTRDIGVGQPLPFDAKVLDEVKRTGGVDESGTTGMVGGVAQLVDSRGRVREGADSVIYLGGFEQGKLDAVADYSVVDGTTAATFDEIALEASWARDHALELGETLQIALPGGLRGYRIVGLFQFARPVDFGGVTFAAVTLQDAQRGFQMPGQLNQINVRAADRSAVDALKQRLDEALPAQLVVRTRSDEVENISEQLAGLNTFLLFFAGVALFVGAFLIFNAFNVTVLQRTREVGMLRTLGATRLAIARQVLTEAVTMGLIGSLLGVAAGVGMAIGLIRLMSEVFPGVPFGDLVVPPRAFVAGILTGTVVTGLGALWPAYRASRTSPVAAMRQRAERIGRIPWRSAGAGLVLIAASIPGVWLLTRGDRPTWQTVYGVTGVVGAFLGVSLAAPVLVRPLVHLLGRPMAVVGRVQGRIAVDNASRAPGRTALTASAVMIGIALVIVFGAFSASAVVAIRESIDRGLKSDFVISPRNLLDLQGFSPELADRVAALPETTASSAVRVGFAEIDGTATQVIAVDPATIGRVSGEELVGGGAPDWAALSGTSALVSERFANREDVAVGDTIEIETLSGAPDRLRVAGIIKSSTDDAAYISTERAERDAGLTQVFSIQVTAGDSPAARESLRASLEALLADFPAAKVRSNTELKNEIEGQFDQIFGLIYALLGVAVIASALGIANTMAMSVLERTREIGLVRAVGGTRGQLRGMIRRESLLVTLVGVVLGVVVGLTMGYAFVRASAEQFPGLEFVVPWGTVVAVLVGAVVVAIIAAALPARRATRLNVIDAVSFE